MKMTITLIIAILSTSVAGAEMGSGKAGDTPGSIPSEPTTDSSDNVLDWQEIRRQIAQWFDLDDR